MLRILCLVPLTLCATISTVSLCAQARAATPDSSPAPIFPKALASGDTIQIIAPAKYLNEERVALCKKRLEAMGAVFV